VIYSELYLQAAKIFTYSALTFIIAMWWAPSLIDLLTWLKFWKKSARKVSTTGEELTVTKQFYEENEKKRLVPRAGGLLIWITVIGFALFFWIFLKMFPDNQTAQFLNFIDRTETFIPIGTLFFASIFGFVDDALATLETGGNYKAGGLKLSHRLFLVTALSLGIGLWFYFRLGMDSISIPFLDINFADWFGFAFDLNNIPLLGELVSHSIIVNSGILIIPAVMLVLLAMWGSSMIDGFDGMSAGVLIPIFLCFGGIAFAREYYDIATLMMVTSGALTAYLWFNIPPAKFYMGDTGTMGLLMLLGVVAFLIDAVYILPIAGLMLVATEASVVLQILSKKILKRKFISAAPLHHHLENIGWLRHQVTMRYWLVSIVASVIGFVIGILT
jgi:phospho-N-acetylmuramoyl-pentapeptide-transferase